MEGYKMKIKRMCEKDTRNINGIMYESKSMERAIKEYMSRDDMARMVQTIDSYDEIQNTSQFYAIDPSKVVGVVREITDTDVDIDFSSDFKDKDLSQYRVAFRMIGKTAETSDEYAVERIIAADLILNPRK